jgi:diadenosine tetraphosphatase ApaH/serine/threonine PP2A family protein phosphatase
MRYAILGDIHSNLTALEAVLADLEKSGGADEVWCLGDIVGYGPDPHECLEIVRSRCSLCIAGNHDLASISGLDTSTFNQDAAMAVRWTSRQLRADEVDFLSGLPLKVERGDFTLAHGSPREPVWEYITSFREAEENFQYFETRYCLIGHSHLAQYFRLGDGSVTDQPGEGTDIKLANQRYIINPGSVGQPRDSDPRAAYAIHNTETTTISFQRVAYDINSVQNRMEKAGLPLWLIERLACGR